MDEMATPASKRNQPISTPLTESGTNRSRLYLILDPPSYSAQKPYSN